MFMLSVMLVLCDTREVEWDRDAAVVVVMVVGVGGGVGCGVRSACVCR